MVNKKGKVEKQGEVDMKKSNKKLTLKKSQESSSKSKEESKLNKKDKRADVEKRKESDTNFFKDVEKSDKVESKKLTNLFSKAKKKSESNKNKSGEVVEEELVPMGNEVNLSDVSMDDLRARPEKLMSESVELNSRYGRDANEIEETLSASVMKEIPDLWGVEDQYNSQSSVPGESLRLSDKFPPSSDYARYSEDEEEQEEELTLDTTIEGTASIQNQSIDQDSHAAKSSVLREQKEDENGVDFVEDEEEQVKSNFSFDSPLSSTSQSKSNLSEDVEKLWQEFKEITLGDFIYILDKFSDQAKVITTTQFNNTSKLSKEFGKKKEKALETKIDASLRKKDLDKKLGELVEIQNKLERHTNAGKKTNDLKKQFDKVSKEVSNIAKISKEVSNIAKKISNEQLERAFEFEHEFRASMLKLHSFYSSTGNEAHSEKYQKQRTNLENEMMVSKAVFDKQLEILKECKAHFSDVSEKYDITIDSIDFSVDEKAREIKKLIQDKLIKAKASKLEEGLVTDLKIASFEVWRYCSPLVDYKEIKNISSKYESNTQQAISKQNEKLSRYKKELESCKNKCISRANDKPFTVFWESVVEYLVAKEICEKQEKICDELKFEVQIPGKTIMYYLLPMDISDARELEERVHSTKELFEKLASSSSQEAINSDLENLQSRLTRLRSKLEQLQDSKDLLGNKIKQNKGSKDISTASDYAEYKDLAASCKRIDAQLKKLEEKLVKLSSDKKYNESFKKGDASNSVSLDSKSSIPVDTSKTDKMRLDSGDTLDASSSVKKEDQSSGKSTNKSMSLFFSIANKILDFLGFARPQKQQSTKSSIVKSGKVEEGASNSSLSKSKDESVGLTVDLPKEKQESLETLPQDEKSFESEKKGRQSIFKDESGSPGPPTQVESVQVDAAKKVEEQNRYK